MSDTLFESYSPTLTDDKTFFGAVWFAIPWTTTSAHSITSIKVYLSKLLNPGTMTVSLRATSGGGPTGADLASMTFDTSGLPTRITAASCVETEITGLNYSLSDAVKYCLVFRVPSGDGSNNIHIAFEGGSSPKGWSSSDSGANWTEEATNVMCLFKIYGIATVTSVFHDAWARITSTPIFQKIKMIAN